MRRAFCRPVRCKRNAKERAKVLLRTPHATSERVSVCTVVQPYRMLAVSCLCSQFTCPIHTTANANCAASQCQCCTNCISAQIRTGAQETKRGSQTVVRTSCKLSERTCGPHFALAQAATGCAGDWLRAHARAVAKVLSHANSLIRSHSFCCSELAKEIERERERANVHFVSDDKCKVRKSCEFGRKS